MSGISRRALLALTPGLLALHIGEARAQRARLGPARVGWLSYLSPPDSALEKMREGLRELGYVEGMSLVFVPRFAEGDFNRLPQLGEVNMSAARALGLTVPPTVLARVERLIE